ncbi:MAG: glycosyltransferase family 2 protein [Xenococcaceae cyanobacterium MO_188.B32]|nr:glycosyltransferase family 2 protein [Xenococcaceae cyanobacterium MO_188.B32]
MNNILTIIPVRNEEATIDRVIFSLQTYGLTKIRVVDNGSSDRSATLARQAGAEVLFEPIPGYGRACYCGLQNLPAEIDWILFCDGDGSDDFTCLPEFFRLRDRYDLILGDRRSTPQGKSAMTPVQNFGNGLASWLIGLGWGHWYKDLGPLRLIRRSALAKIEMQDRGMGWTVEMQVRAVEEKLRIVEIPVIYHPRQGGKSKISGTVSGSIKAGIVILSTLGKFYGPHLKRIVQAEIEKREKLWQWLSGILLLLGTISILPHGDFRQPEAVPQFWSGIAVMSGGFILSWLLHSVTFCCFWSIAILTRSTLYAWNPLVIYSFAGGAHYDSWFILPLVAAWFLFDLRQEEHNGKIFNWLGSSVLLGVATAVKWISLPILGFVTWQAWRKAGFSLSQVRNYGKTGLLI